MPRTSSLCLRRISISSLWRASTTPRWPLDERRQLVDGGERLLDLEAPLACLRPRHDIDLEPALGLLQSPFAGTVDARADRRCGPPGPGADWPAPRRGHRARHGSRPRALAASASAASSASSAGTSASSSAIRPRSRSSRSPASATGAVQGLELGLRPRGDRSASGPAPRNWPRTRRRACRVGRLKSRLSTAAPRRSSTGASCSARLRASSSVVAIPRRSWASSKADAVAPPPATPTRQPDRTETVAVVGHDHSVGIGDGDVDRASAHVDTTDRRTDDARRAVRSHQSGGCARADAPATPFPVARGGAAAGCAEGDDGAMQVRGMERVECPPAARRGRRDDDRFKRLAERGLDRRLPARVDVDQVEQRAEHIFDAGEMLGAGTGPGALEGQVQRLGAGTPTRRRRPRRPGEQRSRASTAPSAASSAGFGCLEVGDEPGLDRPGACSHSARSRSASASSRSMRPPSRSTGAQSLQLALGRGPRRCAANAVRREPRRPRWPPNCWRPRRRWSTSTARRSSPNASSSAASASASGPSSRDRRRPAATRRAGCWRRLRGWRPRRNPSAGRDRARSNDAARRGRRRCRGPARAVARREPSRRTDRDHRVPSARPRRPSRRCRGSASSARSSCSAACSATFSVASAVEARALRGDLAARAGRSATRSARRRDPRGGVPPRPGARAGAAGDAPRAAGPARAASWPRWRRAGARRVSLRRAELQHAGGLFDDRPALLRSGVEHRVDLALAHDHVLLSTDTGVAEQLLHVEQPAR